MNSSHLRAKSSQVTFQAQWYYYIVPSCAIEKVHVSGTLYRSGLQVRISAKAAGNTASATETLLLEPLQYISQWQ
jgi:hypothetical protein